MNNLIGIYGEDKRSLRNHRVASLVQQLLADRGIYSFACSYGRVHTIAVIVPSRTVTISFHSLNQNDYDGFAVFNNKQKSIHYTKDDFKTVSKSVADTASSIPTNAVGCYVSMLYQQLHPDLITARGQSYRAMYNLEHGYVLCVSNIESDIIKLSVNDRRKPRELSGDYISREEEVKTIYIHDSHAIENFKSIIQNSML